MTTTPMTKVGF